MMIDDDDDDDDDKFDRGYYKTHPRLFRSNHKERDHHKTRTVLLNARGQVARGVLRVGKMNDILVVVRRRREFTR